MYSKIKLLSKYISYCISASNGKGHGVHSPFVFEFISKVLNDTIDYSCYASIENLRNELKNNNSVITIEDFGAGSRVIKQKQRMVSAIATSSLKPKKFAQLLFRMVHFYKPSSVIELGTSLGITTAYLASAENKIPVITMEGAKEIAAVAKNNFEKLGLKNIEVVEGNFDETLPSTLNKFDSIDFAFVDGNHRREPTISYFEQILARANNNSIFIFDDIHWSAEMEEAWEIIKANNAVTLTVDLFYIGIVFFRNQQKERQHFTIRF